MSAATSHRIWYVAYGSNLALDRFRCYLSGGPVAGGDRVYPGCRDPRAPTATTRLSLPGRLVFSGRSTVWKGGIAFHDPRAPGVVAGRGYLVTCGQAADVVAQETRQSPGGGWARYAERQLVEETGRVRTTGTGLYDTLHFLGDRDGVPMFTLTHGDVAALTPATPSASYLRWIIAGLRETHGWDLDRIARYLAAVPGTGVTWTPGAIAALVSPEAG
jgi:hypothetical protein